MNKGMFWVTMLLLCCMVGMSFGAEISWVKADFTDASQINNAGIKAAYNLGLNTTVVVNGVTFVGESDGVLDDTYFKYSSSGTYGSANYQPWYYAGGTIAGLADLDATALLGSFVQNSTYFDAIPDQMTLKNLTVGQNYQVQVLAVWNTAPSVPMLFDGDLSVDYTGWGVKAQLVTGTFTADSAMQMFTAGYESGAYTFSNLNAVSIAEVPEPATLVLMAAGGIAALRRKFTRSK